MKALTFSEGNLLDIGYEAGMPYQRKNQGAAWSRSKVIYAPCIPKSMIVLDSSAFFSMDGLPEETHVCPSGVIRELEKYGDPRLALWGDMVNVMDCSKESLSKVSEAAKKTGDLGRLSPVDLTVLALALDVGGTVWSDDYSIQNVAAAMGIGYRAVGMAGIKKKAKWHYRCVGCGKWYGEKLPDCPICGSEMKPYRHRGR